MAEFGTTQLASKLNSDVHFTLSYVETEQKKVRIYFPFFTSPGLVFTIITHEFHLKAGGIFSVLLIEHFTF